MLNKSNIIISTLIQLGKNYKTILIGVSLGIPLITGWYFFKNCQEKTNKIIQNNIRYENYKVESEKNIKKIEHQLTEQIRLNFAIQAKVNELINLDSLKTKYNGFN